MSSSTSYSELISEKQGRKKSPASGFRALVFFALVVLTLLVLGEVLEEVMFRLDYNYPKVRQMMALRGERHDVVYLGDSTTLEGVNPAIVDEQLDVSSYNLATGGQSPIEAEIVLRHYLAHNDRPRLVMLGVYINQPGSEDVTGAINPNVYLRLTDSLKELYHRRVNEATGEPLPLSFRLFNVVKAYRYRTAVDRLVKFIVAGRSRIPELIQGHVTFDFTRGANLGVGHSVRTELRCLDDLLALCKDKGMPVLMFEPPNHPGRSELSRGRADFLDELLSYTDVESTVVFRSYNDEGSLQYAKDEWFGLDHLNRRGAARFTREQIVPYLAQYLGE